MARASDYEGIHRGLDSIRQSILQRKLEEYRAERDAQEQSRYEAGQARQGKLDADMGQFRQSQQKATDDFRKWQMDRANAGDAEKAAATKAAAGQKEYFNTALRASEAGPAMQTLAGAVTNPDLNLGKGLPDISGMTPQDFQPQPLTNERVLRAETAAGLATPGGANAMAMGEEKLAAAVSKASEVRAGLEEKLRAAKMPTTGTERVFSAAKALRAEAQEAERTGDAAGAAARRAEADRLEATQPDYRKTAGQGKEASISEKLSVQKLVDEKRTQYEELMAKPPETFTRADGAKARQLLSDIDRFLSEAQPKGAPPAPAPGSAPAAAPTALANPATAEGQTATNPKTGQKIIFRAGQWQPIK